MPAPTPGEMQYERRGGYRRRMMVPRYSAAQTEDPPAAFAPPQPAAEPVLPDAQSLPPPHTQSEKPPEQKLTERKLRELFASATDLPARIARLDGETLLLLGILWMLWQEKADRRLLLALAYILL